MEKKMNLPSVLLNSLLENGVSVKRVRIEGLDFYQIGKSRVLSRAEFFEYRDILDAACKEVPTPRDDCQGGWQGIDP